METIEAHDLLERIKLRDPTHVCITGGEPLIQPKDELEVLLKELRNEGYTVDIFTNGSRSFDMLVPFRGGISIIMDWKLTGSGEGQSSLETRTDNLAHLGYRDALKFVVKDRDDLDEMRHMVLGLKYTPYRIYVSPAWGLMQPADIVSYVEEYNLPVYLNLQVHKYIWDPMARRI
jgi:7-carboxy-7-deazaguanine synthase